MKPKSWNVRGLMMGKNCLRVKNLFREWKTYVDSCPIVLCVVYGVQS
jgi:hypothetical protein